MFKIRLRVRRYKEDVLWTDEILDRLDNAAINYASAVEKLYMDIVDGWSTENGGYDATPRRKSGPPETRINIYMRGETAFIFAMQDAGFMRKIAIIGGYNGVPKFGKQGTLRTGRLLRKPVPMEAKRYTARIAAAVRAGDTGLGSYREHMQRELNKFIRSSHGGRERIYG